MRVFLYEFVTGGGWFSYGDVPIPQSLLNEARAMVVALAGDLAVIDGCTVTLLQDHRVEPLDVQQARFESTSSRFEELAAFKRLATDADWTIVIAPEFSGFLSQRVAIAEKMGGRVLGPPLPAIRLTSNKHATAEHLVSHGIPVPRGILLETGEKLPRDFVYPAVLKPHDGAGSLGIRLVQSADEINTTVEPSRLEEFSSGQAASVAFLCGPLGNTPLEPCRQHLSDDGHFAYRGGSLPLPPGLAKRAVGLASKAVDSLGPLLGYVGVDLVLADSADGRDDVVIEINPRLTTSYVGLRAASQTNLADAMLAIAEQRHVHIQFNDCTVQFDASGYVVLK